MINSKIEEQSVEGGAQAARAWPRVSGVTLTAIAIALALLAFWEWALTPLLGVNPILLPKPSQVVPALIAGVANGQLIHHGWITLREILLGLACGVTFGCLLAIPVAQFPTVERLAWPYVVGLQAIPKVAIAPLLTVWLGFGLTSKVVIVASITFFPMFVNAVAGFRNTPAEHLELMRMYKSNWWQLFRFVQLPNALPFLFAGLNIAVTLAVIGALVAEFLGAQEGLGALILTAGFELNMAALFAVVAVLTFTASAMSSFVKWLSKRVVFWAPSV